MRHPEENRGNWYLLTGLIFGIGLGLLYAWWINPAQYIDTEPASLAEDYKDEYRKVIAMAYEANQDIGRARTRAALIDPENPARALAAQAQRLLAENLSPREARALAVLAADLGQQSSPDAAQSSPTTQAVAEGPSETPPGPGAPPTATPDLALAVQTATLPLPSATATITLTPAPTFTPRPTATPPQVQDSPFVLLSKSPTCDPDIPGGLLQLQVSDASEQPLPGVRIVVTWEGGEDVFYTGLFPEKSLGYADFQLQTGKSYSIKVGDVSQAFEGIRSDGTCGWLLAFSQTEGSQP